MYLRYVTRNTADALAYKLSSGALCIPATGVGSTRVQQMSEDREQVASREEKIINKSINKNLC